MTIENLGGGGAGDESCDIHLSHANVHHSKKKAGSVVKSTGVRH